MGCAYLPGIDGNGFRVLVDYEGIRDLGASRAGVFINLVLGECGNFCLFTVGRTDHFGHGRRRYHGIGGRLFNQLFNPQIDRRVKD